MYSTQNVPGRFLPYSPVYTLIEHPEMRVHVCMSSSIQSSPQHKVGIGERNSIYDGGRNNTSWGLGLNGEQGVYANS